ncbi:transport and Golgi organization protein 6 homolog isoform X2 [Trachinotus anak]|uniref:transport and Golgi organization protein 6 homolog isoform X2 n=1 Tax=Trachinotus anak TaxID=443729 RepID=UPI0039F1B42B
MTSSILSAISTLTKPLGEASVRDAQSSQQEALLAVLQTNRALLLQQLQSDSSFEQVRRLREEVVAEAEWFSSDTEDATWGFVQECLLLLLTLAQHLSNELEVFQQTCAPSAAKRHTPEMAPPLPPDVLSVTQQKMLGAALQFVVSLGLCPYLAPGVGVPLGRRSAFGAMVEKLVRGGAVSAVRRRLLITTNVLLKLAELSSLATLVFVQHLGDVMAALCQLGYQPHQTEEDKKMELSAEECRTCKEALRSLLGKVYQPIVIKELLILQGAPRQSASGSSSRAAPGSAPGSAPAWLRRLCGQLLSERLMQPNGVQAVVRAILEGGTGCESDWRKCDGVARILVACPKQSASADSYYRQVCPQILDLLHFKDKLTAQQFQRVATRTALSMVQEKPGFAHQYLLTPLLAPLRRCSTASNEGHSQAAVEEWELTRCVEDVYKIWVVGNSPSAALLTALEEVLPVIFTLFCFTKQNVSHLRAPCQGILLWYLSHTETPAALLALRQLSGLQRDEAAGSFHFTPGSDGGASFSSRESLSDESDALYEKLSGEQWRLQCLMQLLAELKDSDLPGDFFLDLLQELTSWAVAADEVKEDEEELDVSTMTLLEVEQQVLGRAERQGQRVVLLQVLAVMVESLQHDVLLRKTTQVVDFIVTLIQRACVGLDQVTDPSLETPVESQTLSMGMGLVATLLSGPQLFLENLEHKDSFIYLSAIQGLAALADSYPEKILERLLKDFQHGPSLPTSNKEHSLETRLKLGEVLMRASRAMGELAPHLGCPLVAVFLQETRDPDQSVRASSLSNLGELCQRLDYALGPLAQELSSCLIALIKTEKQAEVRRAAVHVITLLLRGLSTKTTQVLSDVLLDLYRALKWVVRSDPDDVAVLHAQLALEELDDVMRRFIFPEQKLEKKIVVLP